MFNFKVPKGCSYPTTDLLRQHLLDHIDSNFMPHPPWVEMLDYQDLPNTELLCGQGGLHAFAKHPSLCRRNMTPEESAYGFLQGILMLLQERKIYISLLEEQFRLADDQGARREILKLWDSLSNSWMAAAGLAGRLCVAGNEELIPRFRDTIDNIVEQEGQTLSVLRDYLASLLKRSQLSSL